MSLLINTIAYMSANTNVTKNKLVNLNDNNYFTKKTEHTNNITNNTTRQNHNNYEHNVFKKVNRHMMHINNYDIGKITAIRNYLIKIIIKTFTLIPLSLENKIISNPQQTDITNSLIEINTQTANYIGENYLNCNRKATVRLNPTPSLHEDYLWIPETSDNVVPGLDSMLTYTQK